MAEQKIEDTRGPAFLTPQIGCQQSANIIGVVNLEARDALRILEKTMTKLALAGIPLVPASHLCARNVEEFIQLQHLRAQKLKKIREQVEGLLINKS